MDDIVSECQKRMAHFRVQELKDVLGQLGLTKTGRKQDLVDRILALLYEEASDIHGPPKTKFIRKEEVTKIIEDTYRKMQRIGANDPGTGGHCVSDSSSITPREEIEDQRIRCPCSSPLKTEFMIQCADPECHVLQHRCCVIIPEQSTEGVPPSPSQHYCEVCRINRCDPFWKTLAHPLYPVKLLVSSIPDDGSQPLQNVETGFQITRANVELLENSGYDVQAWCILLNDSVPFRMQWPQYPDLRVNGIPVKTINRPGSKMLGANGRDDGPSISMFLVDGYNKISLSGSDVRTFCLGVRLVKQRTIQQVINLIPSEQEGESFTDAVARVCRCIGGGMADANDDSDSDLEVIADNVTVNLRCPMSGSRMKTAARFKGCVHLGCFDLHTFVQINQRSRKWQCPICLKNYSLEDIIIDPYLNRIVNMMQSCDEDVTEIEVKSDGSWRAKIGRPFMDLKRWHLPDGSLCSSEVDSNMGVPTEKNEHRLTISANGCGVLDVGMPQGMHAPSSKNQLDEYFTNYEQEIISMSSGSSENMKEDEELECNNHCGTSQYNITINKDNVMDSMPYNYNQTSGVTNRSSSSSLGDPSVIVLSDSEEENYDVVSPGVSIPAPPGGSYALLTANPEIPVTHLGDAIFGAASSRPTADVEAESSQTSNSKGLDDPLTFPRQPRKGSRDVKAESSQMSNSKGLSGVFTFPRQPRTVRRHHATKDVQSD